MSKLPPLNRILFCFAALSATAMSALSAAPAKRPNLLFLFTDDQRWDALSCAGNELIRTPNLDSLAARGTRFTKAFVTLSICSPSRAAVLTGRYNSANGVTTAGKGRMNPGEVTFAHLLKQAGYRTGVTGKWHLGNSPQECGFDFSSICHGNGAWHDRAFVRDGVEKVTAPGFVDDFVAGESIRFLRSAAAADSGAPFVLWLCTQVPHMDHRNAWPAAKEYLDRHAVEKMPVPESWQDDLSGKPPYLGDSRSRTQALEYGYARPDSIRRHFRDYFAAVEQMDSALGRVLEELDRLGLRDNTWIFFMGDNGWMMGEHGFTSKVLPYEESIRVPMIVAGPGTESQARHELVLGIDLTATMLEVAGLPVPETFHGRSLLPLLQRREPANDWREAFLYEAPDPQLGSRPLWAVRTERWKYIETEPGNGAQTSVFKELYDLENDPVEMLNLAGSTDKAELVSDLSQLLARLRAEIISPAK